MNLIMILTLSNDNRRFSELNKFYGKADFSLIKLHELDIVDKPLVALKLLVEDSNVSKSQELLNISAPTGN